MAITFEELKGTYRHRKTAKKVEVVSMRGDSLGLRHESGRETYKMVHYFIEEYVRSSEASASPVTCRDCKVGRGYRPMLDYVELCPRHAAASPTEDALRQLRERYPGRAVIIRDGGSWPPSQPKPEFGAEVVVYGLPVFKGRTLAETLAAALNGGK